MKLVDGKGLVLGRMASIVAKELLKGEEIVIINPEEIIIVGKSEVVYEKYHHLKHELSTKSNPHKDKPKIPIRPDLFVKRVIRGMLPRYTKRGREALKRLKVYLGDGSYDGIDKDKMEKLEIKGKEVKTNYVTVGELCKKLGWRGYE